MGVIVSSQNLEIKKSELHPAHKYISANFIALSDYVKRRHGEISVRKNDKLAVYKQNRSDWWEGKNLRTKKKGLVNPRILRKYDVLENEEWYHGNVTRREAERLLEYFDNRSGTYLIRESNQNFWALSVLETDERDERKTKHYRIDKKKLCLTPEHPFKTLAELLAYYSKHDGLCQKLTQPCPKLIEDPSLPEDVWEEKRTNIVYKQKDVIGEGNFGKVYKGIWKKKHVVAIKTIKLKNDAKQNSKIKKEFIEELEVMKMIRHERIVKLWCVCSISEPFLIVIEYMCNGSLLKYLKEGQGQNLNFKEIIDMAAQIASGMSYLSSINFVHRDLAARNCLVGKFNIVKIADFGLGKQINGNDKKAGTQFDASYTFPVKWTAVEGDIYSSESREYTVKSDVWSYGVLLYELITKGGVPYGDWKMEKVMLEVANGYRMEKPDGFCTDEYYDIMKRCWSENPDNRPTFETLYNFFNTYFINIEPSYELQDD